MGASKLRSPLVLGSLGHFSQRILDQVQYPLLSQKLQDTPCIVLAPFPQNTGSASSRKGRKTVGTRTNTGGSAPRARDPIRFGSNVLPHQNRIEACFTHVSAPLNLWLAIFFWHVLSTVLGIGKKYPLGMYIYLSFVAILSKSRCITIWIHTILHSGREPAQDEKPMQCALHKPSSTAALNYENMDLPRAL